MDKGTFDAITTGWKLYDYSFGSDKASQVVIPDPFTYNYIIIHAHEGILTVWVLPMVGIYSTTAPHRHKV